LLRSHCEILVLQAEGDVPYIILTKISSNTRISQVKVPNKTKERRLVQALPLPTESGTLPAQGNLSL